MKTALRVWFLLMFLGTANAFGQDSGDYVYTFEIEHVNSEADDATIKTIKTVSKDLFEKHPTFAMGYFQVTTTFPIPEDRIRGFLLENGFMVTNLEIKPEKLDLETKQSKL